ncbi:putative amidohydrolase [Clostridium acetobutylicum]|uniref:Predicted amidohydrolase n=1 Tax=Clostridium acetobutylicum (strain ATCC 824 / DSM 792 / JCM 1419 / IAM 19013 / LMG 5710 / NBRC 13948 / NRRL B-527 / VKM B-1787 / 2291 / W) TaxID=272562 RepID=Q97IH6_CLOAB|nr:MULTISPECIES: nitrilase-related carbon-nitrogen hydrolase [Clostridium]AAK79631.1 Predicted amidohydrolase [Clostridium acetobutylicum ATCC 824]ADZ20715.1 amidohydrolase [Clostridium acetobutylicum EA 2018]AEI34159.1 amidohydrolase [Clostridium acetobutylicum DSM 1731]AWV79932.1 carbon-nitrogen family hydrolase [Clostridium acetobutylicum]MBC2394082.1 carbon-nitrogen family hydrolase [Clostridium acetobutylicum]
MKIALGQIDVFFEDKERTKEKCLNFMKKAADKKADLIIFPEMTLTGFSMKVDKIGENKFETLEWFKEKSKEFNIYSGFGFVEGTKKGKNNFSICSPLGEEILRYTKLHPFSYGNEDKYFYKGNEIVYCKIGDFNISTFICYDLRFPEIFQKASKESECILIIANWPKVRREQWIALIKARAIETQSYIAAVNRVGEGDGLYYSGDSMVVNPYGEITAFKSEKEELLICDININEVKKCREEFRFKEDRREEFYCKLFMKK